MKAWRRERIDPAHVRKTTKFDRGRFVGWDGEGVCPSSCDGSHGERPCPLPQEYALLKNSEGGELCRPDGISTKEALAFITSEAARIGAEATHVCFGLSYDANMILRDVPRPVLRELWDSKRHGGRVRVLRRYKVAYRARKSLWVKDTLSAVGVNIWDVFGFFQTSFVKALVRWLGRDDPRLPIIIAGKARRGTFKASDLPTIRPYTDAELSALVSLCEHLRAAFVGAGLVLKRWDGAGAAAAALMEREHVKAALAPSPKDVALAARYAYVGGRIEALRYGFSDGPIHHGDIRSAYPHAALDMPRLSAGRWLHSGMTLPPDRFTVIKVRWDFQRLGYARSCLPFAFRNSRSAIYFPRRGVTWAWRPEVDAALAYPDLARHIDILDSWAFRPDDESDHPFAFLQTVYKERARLKRLGDPAEKALKLSPNSVYGKLAQTVGGTAERPPPYHQLEYAGWITSATRARLWSAAVETGPSVICLATDGIYASEPIPGLTVGTGLGQWDYATHAKMALAQSGVYWVLDAWDSSGCKECGGPLRAVSFGGVRCMDPCCGWSNLTQHYRGFDEETLDPDIVLAAWRRRETSVRAESSRFVTMGRASLSDESFTSWRKWLTEPRELIVHATGKRLDRTEPHAWTRHRNPSVGLMDTDPAEPFEAESFPYTLAWAREEGKAAANAQEAVSI